MHVVKREPEDVTLDEEKNAENSIVKKEQFETEVKNEPTDEEKPAKLETNGDTKNEPEEEKGEEDGSDGVLSDISGDYFAEETVSRDVMYAQYDKITRTKKRYRCFFVDVVLHINGKDYIYKKMVGEIGY